jgi:periplasmic divalent cation tolerance protein
MPNDTQLIFCTCPDRQVAEKLAHLLVANQLAACVNIVPNLVSIYRWQGQIETAAECLLLIKAPSRQYSAIENALRSHHPYELPEIIAVPIQQGLPDYLQWILACTPTD